MPLLILKSQFKHNYVEAINGFVKVARPEWNWDGPQTVAEVMGLMGFRIANDAQMPSWVATSPFNRERGTNEPAPPEP